MNKRSPFKLQPGRSARAGALIGVGVMAAVDEIIFHQVLSWHHFYDRSTSEVALMTDGFLHAFELVLLVAGFFIVADLRRRQGFVNRRMWAGFFLGAGGFQLFDGLVDHKALKLHQIRYDVEILPYDLAWNIFAVILLLIGMVLYRNKRSSMTGDALRAV